MMKPGFALSLSFEGIALLQSVADEWHLIGEVTPDAPDLDAALADLRKQALALEPDGPHCKIIIPDEQIRYLSIETGPVDRETRNQRACAALEGATPYAVADLRYDISVQGAVTHVAAVALETLDEARQFALKHGFIPVSYAASPTDKAFTGKAFFDYADPSAERIEPEGSEPADHPRNTPDASAAAVHPDSETAPEPASATFSPPRDKGGNLSTDGDSIPPADTPKAPVTPADDNSHQLAPEAAPTAPSPAHSATPAAQAEPLLQRAPESAVASITASEPTDETARMTVFGARQSPDTGDRRRFPIRPVAVGAFLFLAAVAVWAMLPDRNATPTPGVALQEAPAEPAQTVDPVRPDKPTDTKAATLDAPRKSEKKSDLQPETPYATPHEPDTPAIIGLNDLYVASIDRTDVTRKAANLPQPNLPTDTLPGTTPGPDAGKTVTPDPNTLVTPTPEGTLNPEGVLVYLGRPPAIPPAVPTRFETAPQTDTTDAQLAAMRPRLRPDTLAPQTVPAKPDLPSGTETGSKSPPLRPESLAAQVDRLFEEQLREMDPEEAAPTAAPDDETATASAIPRSLKPNARPGNFATTVRKPTNTPKPKQTAAVAAPATVVPKIPSSASVAQQATRSKAINLRRINLIGVYGPPANRRALVRLSNGRYKKVKIGDTVDGGRVVAIGENNVHYQKGGRGITLSMPSG